MLLWVECVGDVAPAEGRRVCNLSSAGNPSSVGGAVKGSRPSISDGAIEYVTGIVASGRAGGLASEHY